MRRWFPALATLLVLTAASPASGSATPFTVCIGFEDTEAGDLDYNDFGMAMTLDETVDAAGALARVEMAFEALVNLGGDVHDIHVARRFSPDTRYRVTVRRSRPGRGTETPETTVPFDGAGDLDVRLFDTEHVARGDTVTVVVDVVRSAEAPVDGPRVFEDVYDPWMFDRTTGIARHVGDVQAFGATDAAVPFVLVLPCRRWEPVGEYATITDAYPDFASFFLTGDARFARWFE